MAETFKKTWNGKKTDAVVENAAKKRILDEKTSAGSKRPREKNRSRIPPPVASMSKELVRTALHLKNICEKWTISGCNYVG